MTTERPPTIDPQAAQRWARVLQRESPWLHEEVARRMQERLAWIKLQPKIWAHWEPLRGGLQAHALLAERYKNAACFAAEAPANRAQAASDLIAKSWWHPKRWTQAPTRFEPPPSASVDMLWANMALHMAADPQALIEQWQRALAVDGFLMFSCLGPDTLRELRGLYASWGWPAPSHEFTDMHDWGDMLVSAGFADPVMDMERITLSFETPQRLLEELRTLGRNLHPGRFAGLRGRAWRERLHQGLAAQPGPLTLTFEVIYGHAVKAAPRLRVRPEMSLSLDEMRRALQQGKNRA